MTFPLPLCSACCRPASAQIVMKNLLSAGQGMTRDYCAHMRFRAKPGNFRTGFSIPPEADVKETFTLFTFLPVFFNIMARLCNFILLSKNIFLCRLQLPRRFLYGTLPRQALPPPRGLT